MKNGTHTRAAGPIWRLSVWRPAGNSLSLTLSLLRHGQSRLESIRFAALWAAAVGWSKLTAAFAIVSGPSEQDTASAVQRVAARPGRTQSTGSTQAGPHKPKWEPLKCSATLDALSSCRLERAPLRHFLASAGRPILPPPLPFANAAASTLSWAKIVIDFGSSSGRQRAAPADR